MRHERARLAAGELVDVERRVGAVVLVVLGRRARVRLAAADLGEHLGAGRQPLPRDPLGLGGREDAGAQLVAERAVRPRHDLGEHAV